MANYTPEPRGLSGTPSILCNNNICSINGNMDPTTRISNLRDPSVVWTAHHSLTVESHRAESYIEVFYEHPTTERTSNRCRASWEPTGRGGYLATKWLMLHGPAEKSNCHWIDISCKMTSVSGLMTDEGVTMELWANWRGVSEGKYFSKTHY